MIQKILILTYAIVVLLSGCSQAGEETLSPSEDIQSDAGEGTPVPYPYPQPGYVRTLPPYPIDEEGPGAPPIIYDPPSPNAETGVVIGQLFEIGTNQPLAVHTVYLGEKIPFNPGPGYTLGLQERSSPHTVTDEQGRFAIGGVAPGSYVLMVWTPYAASVVMEDTDKELDVVVEVEKTIDLGRIEAQTPY